MAVTRPLEPVAVRDPENEGVLVTLDPGKPYRTDDPLVKAYPWAFASDEDRFGVEDATNNPGRRRSTKRPGSTKRAAKAAAKVDEPPAEPPAEAAAEPPTSDVE